MIRINTHGFKTKLLFWFFGLLPKQDKVVASTFKGKIYGDNTKFIIEELHRQNPSLKIYWMKSLAVNYDLPEYIIPISYEKSLLTIFHIATAKVIIDTHRFQSWIEKTHGQCFIETWHGGLGIKKIEADVPSFRNSAYLMSEIERTNKIADVFISQSDHLSNIYRRAFGWKGPIYKCGYPKNDSLIHKKPKDIAAVRQEFQLATRTNICLYAPSFRDYFYHEIDTSVYNIDYSLLKKTLEKRFGGEWHILVRWHPLFANEIVQQSSISNNVIDATKYPNMQQLLAGSDVVISDYSSCLFDAALLEIPCFTFATDFEQYKKDRGVYFEMEELPFPYAINNKELMENISSFDKTSYNQHWEDFKVLTGLHEPGNSTEILSKKIIEFINKGKTQWS